MPGEVGGAEREPGEVEALAGEQPLGEGRDPARRREQLLAQGEQVSRARAAEDLGRPRSAAEAARRTRARRPRGATSAAARPGRRTPSRRRRRPRRAPAGGSRTGRSRASAAPTPRAAPRPPAARRTRSRSAPAARRGPLERVEDPVVAELDPAVEGVEGAGGEVDRGGLELEPPAVANQPGEVRQAASIEQALERRDAGGVELQHADHAGSGAPRRRASSISAITLAPSAAVASGPGSPPRAALAKARSCALSEATSGCSRPGISRVISASRPPAALRATVAPAPSRIATSSRWAPVGRAADRRRAALGLQLELGAILLQRRRAHPRRLRPGQQQRQVDQVRREVGARRRRQRSAAATTRAGSGARARASAPPGREPAGRAARRVGSGG